MGQNKFFQILDNNFNNQGMQPQTLVYK